MRIPRWTGWVATGLLGIGFLLAGARLAEWLSPSQAAPDSDVMIVYKSPTCGCCDLWIDHLREQGFLVEGRNVTAMSALKERHGLAPQLASCHTAVIDGYVVEGHVPALDIRRLLAERPDALGIAVPGMPIGSPGMEQGDRVDTYETLLIRRDGTTEVYARHGTEGGP